MESQNTTERACRTVTPYLTVTDAATLLAFVRTVFGAEIVMRSERPDGSIAHTEFRIGDTLIMMSGASEQWPPMPAGLLVYVDDPDTAFARALDAGAASIMDVVDTDHGDRMGGVIDPCGNQWWIARRI